MAIVHPSWRIDQPLASEWGISRCPNLFQLSHSTTFTTLHCCTQIFSTSIFLTYFGYFSYRCIVSEVWYPLFLQEYPLFSICSKLLLLSKLSWTPMYVLFFRLRSHLSDKCSHIKPVRLVLTVPTVLASRRPSTSSIWLLLAALVVLFDRLVPR